MPFPEYLHCLLRNIEEILLKFEHEKACKRKY